MSGDLYQRLAEGITEFIDQYDYLILDHDNRDCTDPLAEHLALVLGDLLIDMSGTGQLLASIDRIARTYEDES